MEGRIRDWMSSAQSYAGVLKKEYAMPVYEDYVKGTKVEEYTTKAATVAVTKGTALKTKADTLKKSTKSWLSVQYSWGCQMKSSSWDKICSYKNHWFSKMELAIIFYIACICCMINAFLPSFLASSASFEAVEKKVSRNRRVTQL